MTTQTKNQPIKTLRDGALKASIWENPSEKGAFYSVTFSRSYKKSDEAYGDAYSYSGIDLLRLAKLAERAYNEIQIILTGAL